MTAPIAREAELVTCLRRLRTVCQMVLTQLGVDPDGTDITLRRVTPGQPEQHLASVNVGALFAEPDTLIGAEP